MYPNLSNALRTRFENGERKCARITLNNATVKDLIITEADIVSDSLSIDRYCATGDKIEIGSAVSSELSLVLNNNDGKFDDIRFEGSELKVEIGIKDVDNSYIPCGYFTVDEPPRAFSKISLKALDFMMKFDNDADLTQIPFPCSVEDVVKIISALCGVTVSSNINFSSLPNGAVKMYKPVTTDITYRQILQWVAQVTGTCAYIDWNGELMLSWFRTTDVNITPAVRYSGDILENDISITGVVIKTESGNFVSGTKDYALEIDGNELIESGTEQSKANTIFDAVSGLTYRPYECSCVPMPYLYPLDKITYTDKDGTTISTVITNHTFGLNGVSALAAQGETQQKKGYASQTSVSKKDVDKAIAEAIKNNESTAEHLHIMYSAYDGGRDSNGDVSWSESPDDTTIYLGTCATNSKTKPETPESYTWVKVKGESSYNLHMDRTVAVCPITSDGVVEKSTLISFGSLVLQKGATYVNSILKLYNVPSAFEIDSDEWENRESAWVFDGLSLDEAWSTLGVTIPEGYKPSMNPVTFFVDAYLSHDINEAVGCELISIAFVRDGEPGDSISTVKNYYLATSISSGVTVSTSGWTEAVQTPTKDKKYLWNYEEIIYTGDKTATQTTPCIIGVFGADGKGIKSITEHYLASASSSGVTVSTSGWTTTMQLTDSTKKYLWNYETVTYTDNSTSTTSPVVIGVHGEKGDTGKSISGVTNYYLASSSSSGVTVSTSGWTEAVQTPTAAKKYLWNYEKVTYSDNTSITTAPCIIGNFAEDGSPGVSISSVTEYYARSSSSISAPADSSFSTSVPTLDATYKYLWNYEKIEYTGGKSATTTPKCVIGVFGKDGTSQYVHIRFSAYSNGNNFVTTPSDTTEYMGVAVTTSSTAPSYYTDYVWTKIKGDPGVGTPGEKGADGRTSYVHIKYSNDGTSFTDNNGEEIGSWIGTYTDFTEADSLDFSKYTWKKFTEDVDSTLNDLALRIENNLAEVIKLNERIATLVTDENGYSLMEQSGDGWVFNIGGVTNEVNKAVSDIKDLSDSFSGVVSSIEGLSDAVDDLGVLASYVRVIEENGQPCIELGENDSNFRVKITNTDIKFMEGSTVVAYISNQALNIEKAVIKEEMQVGGFALKKRSNGNVGFMWKGES